MSDNIKKQKRIIAEESHAPDRRWISPRIIHKISRSFLNRKCVFFTHWNNHVPFIVSKSKNADVRTGIIVILTPFCNGAGCTYLIFHRRCHYFIVHFPNPPSCKYITFLPGGLVIKNSSFILLL